MANPSPPAPPIADIGEALNLREQVARAIWEAMIWDTSFPEAGTDDLREIMTTADAALAVVARTPSAREAKLIEALKAIVQQAEYAMDPGRSTFTRKGVLYNIRDRARQAIADLEPKP